MGLRESSTGILIKSEVIIITSSGHPSAVMSDVNIWGGWLKGTQGTLFTVFVTFQCLSNYFKIKYQKHTHKKTLKTQPPLSPSSEAHCTAGLSWKRRAWMSKDPTSKKSRSQLTAACSPVSGPIKDPTC